VKPDGKAEPEHVSALVTGIIYQSGMPQKPEARDNWSTANPAGQTVLFDSYSDLVTKPTSMTIDVYRITDTTSNIKVTCGSAVYYYESVAGTGHTVELQSHVESGVRFTSATVTAIPANEQDRKPEAGS
jgi:hypothetical protein